MNPAILKIGATALAALGLYKLIESGEEEMARVFVSFDYDNDRNYAYLLKAMAANPAITDIKFGDKTPFEIKSDNIGRIKAALTSKIRDATHTVVVVGAHVNKLHRDRHLIGEDNWQQWEIAKSYELGKKLVMVKIKSTNPSPKNGYNKGATWAHTFKVETIARAING